MSRLPDPTGDLDPFGKSVYEKLAGPRGGLHGMYLALMNNPPLAEHVGQLGTYFRFQGTLRGDLRELAILATARRAEAVYEWLMHLAPAEAAGLPADVVEAVLRGDSEHAKVHPLYRAVWQVANLVVAQEVIPEDLQDWLIDEIGTAPVVELVALCGFYKMIAAVAVGFDVPLPRHAEPLPF